MTLIDRLRAQPPQKHADPVVRLAFVQEVPIDDRDLLAEVARTDADARVRRAAVAKLLDPAALAAIAASDANEDVRAEALSMMRDIALDAFEGLAESESLAAVGALTDPKTLGSIAKTALREEVALSALERVRDAHALGSIARHAPLEPIRLAALAALQDPAELVSVALNSEFKDTGVAAVERLLDREALEQVAARGKNKSAVKRARGVLREQDERAAAEAVALLAASAPAEAPAADVAVASPAVESPAVDEASVLEAARAEAEAARQRDEAEALERQRQQARAEEERLRREAIAAEERAEQARRAEALAREARAREQSLTRLIQLAVRVEALAARSDLTLKSGERALRDIRAALADLPPLPSKQERDALVHRLETVQGVLTPKVHELREAADWQRWANVGVQEQICAKMEALASVEDAAAIAAEVRALQEQWRQVSDVPRPQGELLWRRFKAAHDLAWARCETHFAAEAAARAGHLAAKLALCERAEALADSSSWIQTAEEIKRLQAEWKAIGAVTRGYEKAVWERFRAACDRFFTRRQADLVERKHAWAENLTKKEALCAEVEALADSTDWDATASTIKRLQGEWKAVGPVRKSRSDAIWQRFRAACDRFFARYAQRHDIARGERVAAREAICAELEQLASAMDDNANAELPGRVRALRGRWQSELAARGVDRERAAELDKRFAAAFAGIIARSPAAFAGTDLDPDANRKRMEALVRRMEELAKSMGTSRAEADAALSPTTRLAAMLKEALAANTIGGKADDQARMRAALEEVHQAQSSWTRIGPVPDETRRGLADRFSRACRHVSERAGAAQPPKGEGVARRTTG